MMAGKCQSHVAPCSEADRINKPFRLRPRTEAFGGGGGGTGVLI